MKIDSLPNESFTCTLGWVGNLGVAKDGVARVVLTTLTSTAPAIDSGRQSSSVQAVIGAADGECFAIRSRPLRPGGR